MTNLGVRTSCFVHLGIWDDGKTHDAACLFEGACPAESRILEKTSSHGTSKAVVIALEMVVGTCHDHSQIESKGSNHSSKVAPKEPEVNRK